MPQEEQDYNWWTGIVGDGVDGEVIEGEAQDVTPEASRTAAVKEKLSSGAPIYFIGGVLGMVFGLVLGLLMGLKLSAPSFLDSFLAAGLIGIPLGVGVVMIVKNATHYKHSKRGASALRLLASVGIGAVVFLLMAAWYPRLVPVPQILQTLAFGLLFALPAGWFASTVLQKRYEHRLQPYHWEIIEELKKNGYLFMSIRRLKRFMYLHAEGTWISFAEVPPVVTDLLVPLGLPVSLAALATWGVLKFPYAGTIWHLLARGNINAIVGLGILASLLVAWIAGSALFMVENRSPKAMKPINNKKDAEEQKHIITLRNVIVVAILIAVGLLYWWLDFPWGRWLLAHLQHDQYQLLYLLLVPMLIWIGLLVYSYDCSGTLLNSEQMLAGSTATFMPGNDIAMLDRNRITNGNIRQGYWRQLWGYYILGRDSSSDTDNQWHNRRIRHANELLKAEPHIKRVRNRKEAKNSSKDATAQPQPKAQEEPKKTS